MWRGWGSVTVSLLLLASIMAQQVQIDAAMDQYTHTAVGTRGRLAKENERLDAKRAEVAAARRDLQVRESGISRQS